MDKHNLKKVWIALGLVALLIIAVVIFAARTNKKTLTQQIQNLKPHKPEYLSKKDAPKGTIIGTMPPELVVDKQASVQESYQLTQESGTFQATTQFISTEAVATIFDDYTKLLKSEHYKITFSKSSSTLGSIYAVSDTSQVSVQITKVADHSNVAVTFLSK